MNENSNLKLDVRVHPITPMGNLISFASVTINDAFVVDGLRLCVGEKGLFVNMPAQVDKDGKWRDTFFPITAEARIQLTDAVVAAYSKEVAKEQAMLDEIHAKMMNTKEK